MQYTAPPRIKFRGGAIIFCKSIVMPRPLCYNQFMDARVKAYAKLNLTLGITGCENGYHMLESLVCTVDLFDIIKLKKRKDNLVSIEMHGRGSEAIAFENNNAVKAAEAFIKRFGTRGVNIKIYKNIPMGAGMGGSSADAAGVLRGMAKLYGTGRAAQLKEIADSLGSDTGYLLTGGYATLRGRGDIVEKTDCRTRLDLLVLLPKSGVSTVECFKEYDKSPFKAKYNNGAINALLTGDRAALGKCMFNALYAPAVRLNPEIEEAYESLKSFSPLGVNMTGSGSAVYALFENAEFCAWAKSRYRGRAQCIQLKTYIPKK